MRAIIVAIATLAVVSSSAQGQEPWEGRYFVRRESNLRAGPSTTSQVVSVVRPGRLLTMIEEAPQQGYARVRTAEGVEAWLSVDNVRAVALLDVEQAVEDLGGPQVLTDAGRTAAFTMAASGACKTFTQCPASGCEQPGSAHGLANRHKRTIPNTTHPPTLLTFEDFGRLQHETDHLNVPQGEVLSPSDRNKLKNISIGHTTLSEGTYVTLVGFIAADRTVSCGSKESVNCKNTNGANGPCTKTDIHVPLVPAATDDQVASVVVEPIPQMDKAPLWTPAALMDAKQGKKKVLVHGGLFYDSQHIVNTGDGPTSQPKRFTLWEVHPVIAILICDPDANACDPADESAWKPLGES